MDLLLPRERLPPSESFPLPNPLPNHPTTSPSTPLPRSAPLRDHRASKARAARWITAAQTLDTRTLSTHHARTFLAFFPEPQLHASWGSGSRPGLQGLGGIGLRVGARERERERTRASRESDCVCLGVQSTQSRETEQVQSLRLRWKRSRARRWE